jgi:hypothetical protein
MHKFLFCFFNVKKTCPCFLEFFGVVVIFFSRMMVDLKLYIPSTFICFVILILGNKSVSCKIVRHHSSLTKYKI